MKSLLYAICGLIFGSLTGYSAIITWSGTNGNIWDTNNTVNWNNAGSPDKFFAGDNVTFDDSAANGTVTLSGSLSPGSVTINNSVTPYVFGGSGQIGGAASLLKSGTGILTITNTNSYTGGTVISAGTVVITNASALSTSGTVTLDNANTGANNVSLLISQSGSSAITFTRPVMVANLGSGTATIGRSGTGTGSVAINSIFTLNRDTTFLSSTSGTLSVGGTIGGSGNVTFSGGGITAFSAVTTASGTNNPQRWTGNVAVTGNSVVTTTGSANVIASGSRNLSIAAGSGVGIGSNTVLGMLTGNGNIGNSGTASTTLTVGGTNASSTYDGVIGGTTIAGFNIGSSLGFAKTGSGTFTTTGSNTYTGATTISQGKLVISGNGSITHTPTITITSGAILDVSGLNSGTFSLGGSQTLLAGRTTGFANDVIGNLSSSGTLNLAGSGTAGTLTISGNLGLTGGKMLFDFANTTTAGSHVNDLISIGGSLSLSGTTIITPNLLNGSLATGTYTLVSGGGSITMGGVSNLTWGGVTGSRQSITFDTTSTPGAIYMTVSGVGANLIWSGTNGNTWDTNNTVNWINSGTADKFLTGDNVTFNDAAANGNVTLSGSLTPGAVTFNNGATAYTLGGAGQIGGVTNLLKSGTGTLTVTNTNSYTGGTVISAGTVIVSNTNALGSGVTTLADGNTGGNNVALLVNSATNTTAFSNVIVLSSSGSGSATIGRTGTASGLVTISSSMALNRDVTFLSSSSGTLALTGTFSGVGNAAFTGGGVTTLGVTATTGTGGPGPWTGNVSVTGNSVIATSGTSSLLSSGNRNLNVAAGSGVALSSNAALGMLTGTGNVGNQVSNVTLAVGGSNASSTFDGVIGGATIAGYAIGSAVNLTKTGSGTFTMTGNNTYTGTTSVSQGRLALKGNGSMANSPSIAVASGALLDVSGLNSGMFSLNSGQTLTAGRSGTSAPANDVIGNISTGGGTVNVAGSGTAGTLTVSGNLSLSGGNLLFDFANTTTAGSHVNDLISIGGSLSLSGTTIVTPNLLNGSLASGTYTLISGGSTLTIGNSSNLAWGLTAPSRQIIAFDTTSTPGSIYMTVTGFHANLVWSGTNGNTWDNTNTVNWINSGTADEFFAADNVTFNDTASNGNVSLSGSLQAGSVTVNNNTTAYTFGGSGQIVGSTSLLKSGTGTLTISNANSYSGGTVISSGTIIVANAQALSTTGTISLGDVNTGSNATGLLVNASAGTTTFTRPILVSASGSGAATIGRTGTSAGTVAINSVFNMNRTTTFQSSSSGLLSIGGTFSGAGNAVFTGGGVTSLGATSTFSGTGATPLWTGNVSVTGNSVVATTGSANVLASGSRNLNIEAGSGVAIANTAALGMLTGAGNLGNSGTAVANITVGGSNRTSTFDGVIGGASIAGYTIGSAVNLIKTGSGTFTMTGNNTYTGSTTVSQGKLALTGNGSISNSPAINIVSGAVLDVSGLNSGTFSLGGSQTLTAGRTSGFSNDVVGNLSANGGNINIAGSGTAGTLTVSGNLGLSSGNLIFDFANTTTAGSHVNDLISIGGSLSLSGTTTITPYLMSGSLASGTYTLISGASGITVGNASNLAWGVSNSRQTVTFDTTTTPGVVYMDVSGSSANLVWSGSSGTWDSSGTTWSNVTSSGTSDKFYGLDNVVFNDSSASGNVTLSGTLLPGSVTVNNNTTNYTMSGTGQIAGSTTVTKSGTGTLTISGTQAYTGSTNVNNGSLVVNGNIAASGTVSVSAGASLGGHGTVNLIAGSGTVAPGDPVILTAAQVDPSGGLAFNFQFSLAGSPIYNNAAESGNDVLHLTDSTTPFKFALTSANTITIDFTGLTLTQGEDFYGGFFTDATIDPSLISDATFEYTGINSGVLIQYDGLVTVPSADFASGTVINGEVMKFTVTAIPEPNTTALLAAGLLGAFAWGKRKRLSRNSLRS